MDAEGVFLRPRLSPSLPYKSTHMDMDFKTINVPPKSPNKKASKRRMSKAQWTLEESVKPVDTAFTMKRKSLRDRLLEAKAQGAGLSIEKSSLEHLCSPNINPSMMLGTVNDEFILPDTTNAESGFAKAKAAKEEKVDYTFTLPNAVTIKKEVNDDELLVPKTEPMATVEIKTEIEIKIESGFDKTKETVASNIPNGCPKPEDPKFKIEIKENNGCNANASQFDIQIVNNASCKPQNDDFEIKIKHLDLPSFNDSRRTWLKFMKEYNTKIYSQNISNKEKYYHLYHHVDNKAKKLLDHLPIAEDSLEKAIAILKAKYDRRTQIDLHLSRFLNLPAYNEGRNGDVNIIRDILKPVLHSREAIKQFGMSNWDHLFLHVTLSKLPPKLRDAFEIQYGGLGADTCFTDLVVFLQQTCLTDGIDYDCE